VQAQTKEGRKQVESSPENNAGTRTLWVSYTQCGRKCSSSEEYQTASSVTAILNCLISGFSVSIGIKDFLI
jgi:hypothetical protein